MEYSKITYFSEISMMMFGFGDSHKPNIDTEALKYSEGKNLKGEELVFLMRHNKHKMRRFVQYLHNKQNRKLQKQLESNIQALDEPAKPTCPLLDFIEKIDETGEFTDLTELDEVKLDRMLRADWISQALDQKKYLEFCKARTVSFNSKGTTQRNLEKLKVWVDPKNEIIFKPEALDVLAYFAYQTVAEITDYALLVRMDAKAGTDPLKYLPGSYYTATMFNGKHRFEETNPDYSKVYSSQPPISVSEIKEVMRRVHTPQAGWLNFGGKLPETHYLFAL